MNSNKYTVKSKQDIRASKLSEAYICMTSNKMS